MNFYSGEEIPAMPGGQLYNEPIFHQLKRSTPRVFALTEGGQAIARIVFYWQDKVAISGFQAPYGSFDFTMKPAGFSDWLSKIKEDLKAAGARQIIINAPPEFIDYATDIEKMLLDGGFTTALAETNQHLLINEESFGTRIAQKERNKLNRAEAEGYRFEMMSKEQIPGAYRIISDTYKRKKYPVTLPEEELYLAFEKMPEHYFLFGLYDMEQLIAVVASVRVKTDLLYNFYHADELAYRQRSPLVMLLGEVYKFCQQENVKYLDLGISSVNGEKNEGLFRFKENLGCAVSLKKTFVLNYD